MISSIYKKANSLFSLKSSLLLAFFFCSYIASAQVQTIRGTVTDADSDLPLVGASLVLMDSKPLNGTSTNAEGKFRFESLPLGYYTIKVSLIGYEDLILSQLLLESGKELVLTIQLSEKQETLNEVILIGKRVRAQEVSPVSVSTLTQEEVLRFPGTFYDPSRLAMTFAGVASTSDQANNISIRGNSPNSLSWRLEGLEIVNPNHTSNAGTFSDRPTQNGGGVNILSAQLLGTSHFLTGAFPSSYGNTLSGVMDMRLRPGNNEKYEFTAQAGLIGFDLAAEGPISKKAGSSFLVNYRYSFIGLLSNLGVELGDEDIQYQDLAFNVHLPTEGAGKFSLFGMWGQSQNDFFAEADSTVWEFQKDRFDIFYNNDMIAFGATHTLSLGPKTSWNSAFAYSSRETSRQAFRLNENLIGEEVSFDGIDERKASFSTKINHKFNIDNRLTAGLYLTQISNDIFSVNDTFDINFDGLDESMLIQPFINYQRDFLANRLKANIGLHFQHFTFNGSQSLEPRASLKYLINNKRNISIAYGLHSQIQQAHVYFANTPSGSNENLDFTKAHHLVIAFNNKLNPSTTIKGEIYAQFLFDVPIENNPNSTYSVLNAVEEFSLRNLINAGEGENYGVELTLQKTFAKNTFFLINGSVFESKYRAGDGFIRDTRFNSNYIFNGTAGKEFRWQKKGKEKVFGLNGRIAYYGGFRETPINEAASILAGETVFDEANAFTIKQRDFFKIDLRLYFKNNKPNFSSTVSLDIQNASNRKNIAFNYYDVQQGAVIVQNQLGLIPILSYRIEF